MSLDPGTTLGPYSVTAKIGEGGMGEVYRARDTKLDRDVALKVLPEAFTSDPDRLARFEREAKVLASLNHPNIGHIYGLEEAEGTKALVLELIEGPTLEDRIKRGPIPVDEALPIAKQIAEALEAAHEAGVIHRDLKPANIKIREDGTVKVLDFGLAKALDTSPVGDPYESPTLTAAATQMGVIMGTAAYMSPEQARGKPVDKRADIWAFKCVVYEMLTGRRTFDGDDVSEVVAGAIKSEPEWDALPTELPPALRTYLRRCLQKDPRERIRDIGDVRLAMAGAFDVSGPPPVELPVTPVAVPQFRWWQRPIPAAIVALVLVVITGFTMWSLTRPMTAPEHVVRFPLPLSAGQAFSGPGRHIVAVSPSDDYVAFTADEGLWLRPMDQMEATFLSGAEGARGPFFSADGQWLGFWSDGQLKRLSISGGAPVTLSPAGNPYGASWGADGTILFGQSDGIWRVPWTGGRPALVIPVKDGEAVYGPQMLPGEDLVLFTLRPSDTSSWDASQIVVQSLASSERTVLLEGGRDARYLPTAHLVYALEGTLLAQAFDLDRLAMRGGPVALVEDVGMSATATGAAHFGVSANGSLVYVPVALAARGDDFSLTWVDRDGNEERIPAPPRAYGAPRVSPDGARVAVDIADGDNIDIWIWDLARETLTQLTFDAATDDYALWTPDSARVVFTSSREGGGLFWKAADGTGQVERLMDGLARPYTWAADGRLIFEQADDIGVLTMAGERTAEMLLDAGYVEAAPALSSDGRWLAYTSNETGTPLIYVQPFPNVEDGLWNVSVDFGVRPVWSPDGSELLYRGGTNLMVAQIDTEPTFSAKTPEPLFDLSGYAMSGGRGNARSAFDLAPDGDRFILRKLGTAGQTSDEEPFNGLIFVENWTQELLERVPIP